ncbi:DUF2004 domain-containing protein [Hymenobacter persicinus]|uniref:DUF2004 domain-containing protein n=1 Tax=Hymenobacter persicinus TaxID=2025506 RepID=A0A4Q5L6E7_9BACT|nr:DUF2004 domain-containing protein [Hymenobacter persicinus]RYU75315.1 DUF2004 domain-containing protein [Hymenobacter persicinus]
MPKHSLPYFGQIETDNLDEYYDASVEISGNEISIDLNFENTATDVSELNKISNFISCIEKYDIINRGYIENDYQDADGDTVKFYVEHHLEELAPEDLEELIDLAAARSEQEKQLLLRLKLVRVGLYPNGENSFAVFDYSIGEELTDDLIVINTDEKGVLEHMTIES